MPRSRYRTAESQAAGIRRQVPGGKRHTAECPAGGRGAGSIHCSATSMQQTPSSRYKAASDSSCDMPLNAWECSAAGGRIQSGGDWTADAGRQMSRRTMPRNRNRQQMQDGGCQEQMLRGRRSSGRFQGAESQTGDTGQQTPCSGIPSSMPERQLSRSRRQAAGDRQEKCRSCDAWECCASRNLWPCGQFCTAASPDISRGPSSRRTAAERQAADTRQNMQDGRCPARKGGRQRSRD